MNTHEQTEARILIEQLLAQPGATVSVYDGEEWALKRSRDLDTIMAALGSTDNDELVWRDASGARLAWFWLIYGNSPGELIADHTANDDAERVWKEVQRALGDPFGLVG